MPEALIRIVDDDPGMLDALRFLLETEGYQVRTYASAKDFLVNDTPSVMGCIVLDVAMPGMTGIELQQVLNERHIFLPIVFLTGHGDIDMAIHAIRSGAVEFLQKPLDHTRFLKAVAKSVAKSKRVNSTLAIDPFEARARWSQLTQREQQIVSLVAEGDINRVIARRLGLSVRTVEVHRSHSFAKLGIKTVAELHAYMAMTRDPAE